MCFGWRHRPSCASPRVQVSALSSAVPDGKKKELLRIDKFIKAIDEGTLHVLRALGPCALVAVKDGVGNLAKVRAAVGLVHGEKIGRIKFVSQA